jgi:hypothetical protein
MKGLGEHWPDVRTAKGWGVHALETLVMRAGKKGTYTIPDRAEGRETQQAVLAHLTNILRNRETGQTFSSLAVSVQAREFIVNGQRRPYSRLSIQTDDVKAAFLFHALQVLNEDQQAARLRRCKDGDCQRIYLSLRQKQQFCSTRCQTRDASRRSRRKHAKHK